MDQAVYQAMIKRAMDNEDLAAYLLLFHAAQAILRMAPDTLEQVESQDYKDTLAQALARLGEAITRVVPYEEFYFYTPASAPQARLLVEAVVQQTWKRGHGHDE